MLDNATTYELGQLAECFAFSEDKHPRSKAGKFSPKVGLSWNTPPGFGGGDALVTKTIIGKYKNPKSDLHGHFLVENKSIMDSKGRGRHDIIAPDKIESEMAFDKRASEAHLKHVSARKEHEKAAVDSEKKFKIDHPHYHPFLKTLSPMHAAKAKEVLDTPTQSGTLHHLLEKSAAGEGLSEGARLGKKPMPKYAHQYVAHILAASKPAASKKELDSMRSLFGK